MHAPTAGVIKIKNQKQQHFFHSSSDCVSETGDRSGRKILLPLLNHQVASSIGKELLLNKLSSLFWCLHLGTYRCYVHSAAQGEKHSVCQSDGSLGLGERGGVGRETGTLPQDSEAAPNSTLKFALPWERKTQRLSSPRASTNKKCFPPDADTDTILRLRDCEGNGLY